MPKTVKPQFKMLSGVRVPPIVHAKLADLETEIRYSRHPQATREALIGALIYSATVDTVAAALDAFNPELGQARRHLEKATAE